MIRLWLCLGLVLFAPGGGVLSAPQAEVCSQRCADDDEQGQCAPDCADCACCSHVRPLALAVAVGLVWVKTDTGLVEWTPVLPPTAEPGEILHVPIAHLA